VEEGDTGDRLTVPQADLMQDDGCDVVLFAPHLKGDSVPSESLKVNLVSPQIAPLVPRSDFLLLHSFQSSKMLRAQIRPVDVVHISVSREMFPIMSLWAALRSGKRVVVQPHGMLTARSSWLHKLVDVLVRPMVRKSHAIIALTSTEQGQLQEWLGAPRSAPPIHIIGNPISIGGAELDALTKSTRSREAIFIARLHPRKNVAHFVAAARHAHIAGWSDQFVVVGPDQGDAPVVREGVNEIANLTYEGAISGTLVGARLARARVFVLPSFEEPWGNVLLSALALGVPVVICESAALAAPVRASGAGVVVKDGDYKALAEGAHQILDLSTAEYDQVSARARDLARRLSSSPVLQSSLRNAYGIGVSNSSFPNAPKPARQS
jgi:glycosyltransferase involved in cell wall biosynthesis